MGKVFIGYTQIGIQPPSEIAKIVRGRGGESAATGGEACFSS